MEKAHLYDVPYVTMSLKVDPQSGLTTTQSLLARKQYGENVIPEDPPTPLWRLVLDQFQDQLTLILLVSALVSFVLALFEDGETTWSSFVDPVVILSILILNAVVGVHQEKSAEEAIAALGKYSSVEAKVLRNRQLIKVNQSELVPGDIVDLAPGNSVPADCRLIEIFTHSFMVDQSILTGESESVSKTISPVTDSKAVLQDMSNIVFSGTNVTAGHARAVVVLTGPKTAIGGIHKSIVSQISEPTPLKQKLDDFGDSLAKVITIICVLVWLINIKNFNDPSHNGTLKGAIYYFKIAIALAVAAIPEGLAVVITTCLALGTKKMAKKNAIVRNLPSVETLGSTNIICSDKTGTLTTNQMCVKNVFLLQEDGSFSDYQVEGSDYSPIGNLFLNGVEVATPMDSNKLLYQIALVSSLCNDSKLVKDESGTKYLGEPTEAAFRVLVEKLGGTQEVEGSRTITPHNDAINDIYPRICTFEFTRDRKCMSVVVKDEGKSNILLTKGAPESVLGKSSSYYAVDSSGNLLRHEMNSGLSAKLAERATDYAKSGLRVMALAIKSDISDSATKEVLINGKSLEIESNLTFLGLVSMQDPPRPEVLDSVHSLQKAGLRIIMVTGDGKDTAASIGKDIGLFDDIPSGDASGTIFTGRELEDFSDEQLRDACKVARIFSRVEPSHKSIIVRTLQELGNVVAVTGDGVNDAPALKGADIGIAMGSGTDVAKAAADMVLADDNFSTIEKAVEEGRAIYYNTKQFIRYLISSNIGEVVSIFLTVLLGLPEALIPVQLLWVNLVTDGLPATALGFNPPDNEIMLRAPRPRNEPLVNSWLFLRYMVIGTYVGAATVFGYVWWFVFYSEGPQISFHQLSHFHHCQADLPGIGCEIFTGSEAAHGSTMSLSILVVIEMFNALNSLSESDSLLVFPVWKNMYLVYAVILSMLLHLAILYIPMLQALFSTVPLNKEEWIAVLAISGPVIVVDEAFKFIERATLPVNQVSDSVDRKTR